MNLINVLESELRNEALRRWKIAKEVAKQVNGVIYGSVAAMMVEGLPRLPRNVYIYVDGNLDSFLGLFKKFVDGWHHVMLDYKLPDSEGGGKPEYFLLLLDRDNDLFIHVLPTILSTHAAQSREIDGVRLNFRKEEYIQQVKQAVIKYAFPTVLEILDLFWFEGEKAWEFVNSLPDNVKRKIIKSVDVYSDLIPEKNMSLVRKVVERMGHGRNG